jgi:hypothetical protein
MTRVSKLLRQRSPDAIDAPGLVKIAQPMVLG